MKKGLTTTLFLLLPLIAVIAQNYPNIVNYHLNTKHIHGVKIKTNIPYDSGNGMYIVKVEGYYYNDKNGHPINSKPVSLQIVWYPATEYGFVSPSVSSSGASNPKIWLSSENGKTVIFLDNKVFFLRFTVSAFAQGIREQADFFKGWTVVDEPLAGDYQTACVYKNNFDGNVGIGTENPQANLDVRGKIIANEVQIKVNTGADFVFDPNYPLAPLSQVETFIKENKHLPEIPSEKEMIENGVSINEMQIKLLQKIEELTLYVIDLKKENQEMKQEIHNLIKNK